MRLVFDRFFRTDFLGHNNKVPELCATRAFRMSFDVPSGDVGMLPSEGTLVLYMVVSTRTLDIDVNEEIRQLGGKGEAGILSTDVLDQKLAKGLSGKG